MVHTRFQQTSLSPSQGGLHISDQRFLLIFSTLLSLCAFLWSARYTNSDLNGDGDKADLINAFDLMSYVSPNDAIDGKFATWTSTQWMKKTTRHEAGHAVNIMHPESANPPQNPLTNSVMRGGYGTVVIDDFTSFDKAQVKLKP